MPVSLTTFQALVSGVFGALIGSFFNVVAWRLPRKESLLFPASHCPKCDTAIKPWHNVPVVGWLALRGRCASCKEHISARYPVVEAATAALVVTVFMTQDGPARWLGVALVLLLVPITLIDLDHQIIPNVLNAIGAVVALALLAITDPHSLPVHLAYGAGAATFLFIAVLAYPSGMGMGDVKLAGVLGLFLGSAVIPGMFIGFVAGTVVGLGVMARVGVAAGRKTKVPFGPFLALGAVVAIFAGHPIIDWYLATFA